MNFSIVLFYRKRREVGFIVDNPSIGKNEIWKRKDRFFAYKSVSNIKY